MSHAKWLKELLIPRSGRRSSSHGGSRNRSKRQWCDYWRSAGRMASSGLVRTACSEPSPRVSWIYTTKAKICNSGGSSASSSTWSTIGHRLASARAKPSLYRQPSRTWTMGHWCMHQQSTLGAQSSLHPLRGSRRRRRVPIRRILGKSQSSGAFRIETTHGCRFRHGGPRPYSCSRALGSPAVSSQRRSAFSWACPRCGPLRST
mmetsp:Transcript_59158/g.180397  ORF Transcript_59158/g.180397 Transcript_59158/m.180397 type:complete len:204 (+) Transcript_59158:3-614(+)